MKTTDEELDALMASQVLGWKYSEPEGQSGVGGERKVYLPRRRPGGKMKYRIHYTVNGHQDHFDVSGETLDDVSKKAIDGIAARGLDADNIEPWSEEIK